MLAVHAVAAGESSGDERPFMGSRMKLASIESVARSLQAEVQSWVRSAMRTNRSAWRPPPRDR